MARLRLGSQLCLGHCIALLGRGSALRNHLSRTQKAGKPRKARKQRGVVCNRQLEGSLETIHERERIFPRHALLRMDILMPVIGVGQDTGPLRSGIEGLRNIGRTSRKTTAR